MQRLVLVIAMIVGASAQNAAPSQPYDVKGVLLGSPLSEWQQAHSQDCRSFPETQTSNEFMCFMVGATYAGSPASEIVIFYNGRLASFQIELARDKFQAVADALKQKFGEPLSVETKTYQNGFGATFRGGYVIWDNGVSTIVCEEYGGKGERLVLMFMHKQLVADQEKAKKGAKRNDM